MRTVKEARIISIAVEWVIIVELFKVSYPWSGQMHRNRKDSEPGYFKNKNSIGTVLPFLVQIVLNSRKVADQKGRDVNYGSYTYNFLDLLHLILNIAPTANHLRD